MMQPPQTGWHHPAWTLGDIGASLMSAVAVASHLAELLQPLATFALTAMGIVWWCIRFAHYREHGTPGEKE